MTSPLAEPTTSGRTGFWAGIPRGARLDERHFASRHRIIAAVLAVHLPVLAAIGLARGVSGWLLWGQLAAIVALLVLGSGAAQPRSPAPARSASG